MNTAQVPQRQDDEGPIRNALEHARSELGSVIRSIDVLEAKLHGKEMPPPSVMESRQFSVSLAVNALVQYVEIANKRLAELVDTI